MAAFDDALYRWCSHGVLTTNPTVDWSRLTSYLNNNNNNRPLLFETLVCIRIRHFLAESGHPKISDSISSGHVWHDCSCHQSRHVLWNHQHWFAAKDFKLGRWKSHPKMSCLGDRWRSWDDLDFTLYDGFENPVIPLPSRTPSTKGSALRIQNPRRFGRRYWRSRRLWGILLGKQNLNQMVPFPTVLALKATNSTGRGCFLILDQVGSPSFSETNHFSRYRIPGLRLRLLDRWRRPSQSDWSCWRAASPLPGQRWRHRTWADCIGCSCKKARRKNILLKHSAEVGSSGHKIVQESWPKLKASDRR